MTGIAGLNKKQDFVLVIRDADVIATALREVLAEASDGERAGLERAVALVEARVAVGEAQLRADWVRARLAAAGFTGDVASIAAVRALRKAEPTLSLLAAALLQKDAVAHPE
ncbi:hypothetical protein OG352_26350 [Streptomyces sp. NBC_01485]|uniref:hypothetical protein n=1 Tax=Streptomyces sp. NBC_01485 TaxID=2903884 RepID=UPI002E307FBE|nr:hypothetical protein [Streptomyces sp. NBC_01485]